MAERPQLRETTATGTGTQVTQAEPHLPRLLQPFTVPVGGRSVAEPSPPLLILNFPSPAPLPASGLQRRAPAGRGWTAVLYQHFPRPAPPVARDLVHRGAVSRTRKEPKCAPPPRAKPVRLHRLSFSRYSPRGSALARPASGASSSSILSSPAAGQGQELPGTKARERPGCVGGAQCWVLSWRGSSARWVG